MIFKLNLIHEGRTNTEKPLDYYTEAIAVCSRLSHRSKANQLTQFVPAGCSSCALHAVVSKKLGQLGFGSDIRVIPCEDESE